MTDAISMSHLGIYIENLTDQERSEYEELVKKSRNGMFAHSLKYLGLLQRFTKAEPTHIVAKMHDRIVGVLPSLLKRNSKYGNVLNSLPFYGMHGGAIVSPDLSTTLRILVKNALLNSFKNIAGEHNCISSILLTTPFETDLEVYEETLEPEFIVKRRAQIIVFPETRVDIEQVILYKTIESRCRRAIRKAKRYGVTIEWASDSRHVGEFYEMHRMGIEKKGVHKPKEFFVMVFREMDLGRDFNLLLARKDGKIIGGLLLFYYKNMVEYFTPAFDLNYSSLQPNSLLIYEGMKEMLRKGYRIWNFGGTGWSQDLLHLFKRSWGAKDYPYHLLVNTYNGIERVKTLTVEEIRSEYPWFYVIPFTELKGH